MPLVDLSAPIVATPPEWPEALRVEVERVDHAAGAHQIERLTNLGALPPSRFQVACFPLRVAGGSAGPARVVAIVPD